MVCRSAVQGLGRTQGLWPDDGLDHPYRCTPGTGNPLWALELELPGSW